MGLEISSTYARSNIERDRCDVESSASCLTVLAGRGVSKTPADEILTASKRSGAVVEARLDSLAAARRNRVCLGSKRRKPVTASRVHLSLAFYPQQPVEERGIQRMGAKDALHVDAILQKSHYTTVRRAEQRLVQLVKREVVTCIKE